ncbi:MAG: flagellar export protein FliJ [Firmicutes bacterium]|nr:flagellar export protein FliJ [Candidatus Colivicinus equi]
MARGRKSITLDEQLLTVNEKIEKCETELKDLKAKKKDLEKKIKDERMSKLFDIVEASGKTLEEVEKILTKPSK